MTVFKGYLLMTWKTASRILLYFGIFMFLTVLSTSGTDDGVEKGFAAQKMNILLVDEDHSELSEKVTRYLEERHEVTNTKYDKKQLYETLYYQKGGIDMVLYIPEGMEENAGKGQSVIELTQSPGNYGGIYVEQQISRLIAGILDYRNVGYSMDEAYEKMQGIPEANVSVLNVSTGEDNKFSGFFRCVPYMFLAGLGCGVGMIIFSFRRKQVKNRMMASAVSLFRQNAETILAVFCVGMFLLMITVALAVLQYGTDLLYTEKLPYYLLNLFIDMLLALSLAFLVGMLAKKENVITMVFTPLSLVFSFLGGVFVPLAFLSSQIRTIGKFIPVYWYEIANDLLAGSEKLDVSVKTRIWQAYGMQLLFVVAIFAMGMVVAKRQQQEG
ncbi:MAG: ABC transporter permease [Lachnospiraceae bacterium]|nr:ABC transporter permease [Lachnospiraceae bacterium]